MENQPPPTPPVPPTQPEQTEEPDAADSLEAQTTVVTDGSAPATPGATPTTGEMQTDDKDKKNAKKKSPLKGLASHINIYLLLFILVILIVGMIAAISFVKSRQAAKEESLTTEPLSEEALDQLRQSDVTVGDPKQILNVESNAIFAGKVLIRDGLEVAGQVKFGGPLNLPGISVSGSSNLDQVKLNTLQVASNATIQGNLGVQGNLSVSGSGSFGGTLTAARLNIENLLTNGDLQLNRHIDAGGGTPGKIDGPALGSGGTSSVSGTDTAGTVSINTGGGPGPGCFITVNFANRFGGIPHVVVTPIGSAAGGLNYYLNRSGSSFSVCSTNSPPGGQSFAFDYIVID